MITLQLLQQIIVFFLMMACGFAVVKRGLIDANSSRTLSVICIYIIMPCVMINAFQIEYSRSIRNGFLLAIAAAECTAAEKHSPASPGTADTRLFPLVQSGTRQLRPQTAAAETHRHTPIRAAHTRTKRTLKPLRFKQLLMAGNQG